MSASDRHAGNVILLRAGLLYWLIALVEAWLLIFAGPMQIPAVVEFIVTFDKLLSSHLDYIMMGSMLIALYACKVPIPAFARWPLVIGAFTNPLLFFLEAIAPANMPPGPGMKMFIMASIVTATFGFAMSSIIVLRSTLKD